MSAESSFTSNTYVTDNTGQIDWKTLKSEGFNLELRCYTRELNTKVDHGSALIPIIFDVLESSVKNDPPHVHKSTQHGLIATAASTVVDTFLNGAWDELKRFADSYTVTKTRQANTTLTGTGLLTVEQDLKEHNPANWLSDVITVPSWATRNKHEVDAELGLAVTITESVVAHGTARPTNTTGAFYEQRQVDSQRDILTAITLDGGVGTFNRTTYETIQFTFPGIFLGYSANNGFLPGNRRSIFQFNPNIRSPFTAPTKATVNETLVTAATAATLLASSPNGNGTSTQTAVLWTVKPRDLQYSGVLFSVNVPNVLVDAQSITATTSSDDSYYGAITETYTTIASSPTMTAYVAAIGTTKAIEDFVKPWKYGLFWRRIVTIDLQ